MAGANDIGLVVPVHAGGEPFRRCLAAASRLSPPPGSVVVVCDGGCPADVAAAVEVGLQPLILGERRGPAAARNAGAARTAAPILLFLDADVEAQADLISRVAAQFAADPGLSAVIGSYDAAPAAPGLISQYRNLLHHFVHQTALEQATTFWGACGAVRRQAFEAVGGFDDRYREPSVEDIELGLRLSRAGHRIRLERSLQVKHLKAWSLVAMLRTDVLRRAVPWSRLLLASGHWPRDLNLTLASRVSAGLALVLAACPLLASTSGDITLAVAATALSGLLYCNALFYAFLISRRGVPFALAALPLHWLYYFYSGLAFAWCVAERVVPGSWPTASDNGGRTNARLVAETRPRGRFAELVRKLGRKVGLPD